MMTEATEYARRPRYPRGKLTMLEWPEVVQAAIEDGFPIYPMTARKALAIGGCPIREVRKEPAGVGASWFEWNDVVRYQIEFATLMTGVAGHNGRVFVGLDVDRKGGRDGLAFLEGWELSDEEGYATPNGGLHFVFEWDDTSVPPTTSGKGFEAFPGVEIKGSGNHGNLILWGQGYEACYLEKVLPPDRFPTELLEQPEARPREAMGRSAAVVDADLQRVVENLGLRNVAREGEWLSFCCPLHRDTNPSAGLNLETGVFHCFCCGSLSLIDFHANAAGMSRREARWWLTIDHERESRTAAELQADGYAHYEATDADFEPPDDGHVWRQCRLPSCREWLRWSEDGRLLLDRDGREHTDYCNAVREGDVEMAWAIDTDEPYWRLRKKQRAVKRVRGGVSGQRRVRGISRKRARLEKVWQLREEHPDLAVTKFVTEVLTRELNLSVPQAWRVWRESKYGDRSKFTRRDLFRL